MNTHGTADQVCSPVIGNTGAALVWVGWGVMCMVLVLLGHQVFCRSKKLYRPHIAQLILLFGQQISAICNLYEESGVMICPMVGE